MSAQRNAFPVLSTPSPNCNADTFITSFAAAVHTLVFGSSSYIQRFDDDGLHLVGQSYDLSSYRLPAAGAAVCAGASSLADFGAALSSSAAAASAAATRVAARPATADDTTALRSSGVALAASCATVVAKSLLHPLDTLKCRMQLYQPQRGGGAAGWWHGLREAYAGRWSPTALYGGVAIKVMLYVPYQTVYMCSYNYGREALGVDAARREEDRRAYVSRTALAAVVAELGSCVVRVPMETIKMWVQSTASANTMEAARQLRRGGLRSCLRLALPQTLLHDIPYSVTQWVVYETLRPWAVHHAPGATAAAAATTGPQSFWQRYSTELLRTFLTGGFSGLIASALTVPLDSMRTRMVVAAAHEPGLTLPVMARRVYTHEGVRGFFKGGSMRVLWVTANMAVYFPLFELFKRTALEHQRWRDCYAETVAEGQHD